MNHAPHFQDSHESSLAPQFESINFLTFNLLSHPSMTTGNINICFFTKVFIHFRPILGLSYGTWGSFIAARGLLSSCGMGLSYFGACGILVPRPEIEPMCPALEGGFLTIGPPRKSHICFLKSSFLKTRRYLDI